MIQVLIIDDQALVRTGLQHLLAKSKGISKVLEASSGEAALSSKRRYKPDIILLSVNLPGVTGFAGGRPKVEEIVAYWPALISKAVIEPAVTILRA